MMILKIRIIILCLCAGMFLCLPAYATSNEAETQLFHLLRGYHGFSGHFQQIISNARGRTLVRASGSVAIKRPQYLRWEVRHPYHQLLVTGGGYFWMVEPALRQAVRYRLSQHHFYSPAILFNGSFKKIKQRFVVREMQQKRKQRWFKLFPRSKHDGMKWMVLHFNGKKIVDMLIKDKLGHRLKIYFSRLVINPKLDNRLFAFHPSKGMEVIISPNAPRLFQGAE